MPDSGIDLCSQPTVSRWENAPSLRELIRLMGVLIDLYCASYPAPPKAVTLDIDDTLDVVHGHQQLSLFNAHYDERCFLPIHVYDTAKSRPVAVLLRPGKTRSGREVAAHLRRLVRRLRRHWPATRITLRGDSHDGRPEVMDFCEQNGIDFVLGLSGNAALARAVEVAADDIRTRRAFAQAPVVRGYAETAYQAKSRQLRIYGYLVKETPGWWPERGTLFPAVGAGIEVLLTPEDCEQEAAEAVALLDRFNESVVFASEPAALATASPETCKWCPYKLVDRF